MKAKTASPETAVLTAERKLHTDTENPFGLEPFGAIRKDTGETGGVLEREYTAYLCWSNLQ